MNIALKYHTLVVLAAALGGCASEATNGPVGTGSSQPASQQPAVERVPQTSPSTQEPRSAIPAERSAYYDLDRSELRPEARTLIEANARYLREHPGLKARIEGNADERGSAEYNLALGQRRAEGVAKALGLLGVTNDRIEAVSFGKEKPRETGHDEASWAKNRRSDIVY